MDFKSFDWSFKSIAKILGLVAVGIIVFGMALSLIAFAFRTMFMGESSSYDRNYYNGGMMNEMATSDSTSIQSLSKQVVIPPTPGTEPTSGDTAEDLEIREHNGTIKTRKLDETCGTISELKALDYVVFENANEGKTSCYYSFKVKIEKENEILAKIKALNPESFDTQIYTIKKIVDDYDSELDILQKKLASIETTLADAQKTYDDLQVLATDKEDIESLAKIIDSKLNLINTLTQQRIEIRTEIDQFNKAKSEQLDRLNYAYFNLNIYEDLYFDFEAIKNSWKYEIKDFVNNFNELLQGISIQLARYVLNFIVGTIYFLISMGMLKIVWLFTKKIWVKKK